MKTKFLIIFLVFSQLLFSQNEVMEDDENILGIWEVENGIFIDNENSYNQVAKEIWKVFYNLFPKKETQKYVKRLVLFTDGIDEKAGAVFPLKEGSNEEWQLMFDIKDVNFSSSSKEVISQSIYTMIHEFGHLITLNSSQIIPNLGKKTQKKGEPYVTYEGQSLENSYINRFVNLYWNGALLKEWDFIRKKYCVVEQETCIRKLSGFYDDNYNDFLTDYAAESPEEDIVESWTEFVLRDSKIRRPGMVAHKKVNFFYNFPKMLKYRRIIRKNLTKFK